MKDIKTKECRRAPKLKDPMSRMPKELMRDAVLKSKEKSHGISEADPSGDSQESPVEYANRKVASAEERGASLTVRTISGAGRVMAKKSYEKIKERRRGQAVAEEVERSAEECVEDCVNDTVKDFPRDSIKDSAKQPIKNHIVERAKERRIAENPKLSTKTGVEKNGLEANRIKTKAGRDKIVEGGGIKVKRSQREVIHSGTNKIVKTIPGKDGASLLPVNGIRTCNITVSPKLAGSTIGSKKQADYAMRASKRMAVKSAKVAGETAQTVKKTTATAVRGITAAVKAAVSSTKALSALAAAGGGLVIFLVIIVGVIGGVLFSSNSQSAEPLSQEVLDYAPVIQRYAQEYGIPEYVQVIQAIMMQESRDQGNDPMQASECPFNTRFANSSNAITDPEYSIQVGIQYYAYCVQEAGCTGPQDLDKLKLSIQGYNYGNGYISWAVRNHGGYSEANALQFSQEQAAAHGWSGYGDPEYVAHVMRYYSGGNIFAGLFGNSQMMSVAMSQLGNEGGQKFWSWYGFSHREEWCACFVSWCADQCGLITSGAVPKFASCPVGVNWFKGNGKWQENSYSPSAGTIIFFDWDGDGVSDHVGIVEKCENGRVYTVEGNSNDMVQQSIYTVGSNLILGYGCLI